MQGSAHPHSLLGKRSIGRGRKRPRARLNGSLAPLPLRRRRTREPLAALGCFPHGGNLVATLRIASSTELAASYVWGNDLNGSEQGAGGVGGLLFARFYPANNYNYTPATVVYYGYDGNGNVNVLYNPASQTVAAAYEYDAFGQILRQTGPTADGPLDTRSIEQTIDVEVELKCCGRTEKAQITLKGHRVP